MLLLAPFLSVSHHLHAIFLPARVLQLHPDLRPFQLNFDKQNYNHVCGKIINELIAFYYTLITFSDHFYVYCKNTGINASLIKN